MHFRGRNRVALAKSDNWLHFQVAALQEVVSEPVVHGHQNGHQKCLGATRPPQGMHYPGSELQTIVALTERWGNRAVYLIMKIPSLGSGEGTLATCDPCHSCAIRLKPRFNLC